jgi:hypothetical protein
VGILGDLSDCFPDTVIGQPVSKDAFGEFTASGASTSIACKISQKSRLIRDPSNGREVVSSFKVTVAGTPGFNTRDWRYTLPARFSPRVNLEAMAVKPVSDEDGQHHEVLFFP